MKAPKATRQFASAASQEPHGILAGLFNAIPLGFGVLDEQLRYRAVNKALATMNRVAPQAHLGRTIRDVIGEPAVMLEAPFRHVVFSAHPVSVQFWAKLLNRKKPSHWIVNYFPIACAKGSTKLVGAVVVETSRPNEAQQLFRGIADQLIHKPLLTSRDSDALLQQIMGEPFRQIPDAGAELHRSKVVGVSNRMTFFPSHAMPGTLEDCCTSAANATPGAVALTRREREVVKLLVEGTGNKETATILGITVKTVETHRSRIMLKLGLHSTKELVHYAIHNKMLNLVC
ncbi:MAG: LuxR C-terminal-related transcriptional regulator [Terriglobales bacterium]